VKTHLQSQAASQVAVGHQHNHLSMSAGLWSIYSQHGITGLWRGSVGFVPRMLIASATQLSTFTLCREHLDKTKVRYILSILINFVQNYF
jgi:solute carrier family 25 protein 34/35